MTPTVQESPAPTRALQRLDAEIASDAGLLAARASAAPATLRTAQEALRIDEIAASTALAGYRLERPEVVALVARGVALGGRALADYEAVADYAEAASFVATHEPFGVRVGRAFIRIEDVLELHKRALHRTSRTPGAYREHNVAAVRSGLVPPPHWLIPREVSAYVDRFAPGPPPHALTPVWVASAHARFLRIQPFDGGNGRVARLIANLLLRRLGLPIAAFAGTLAARYRPALATADGGELGPLALLTAEAVRVSLTRLLAATNAVDELRPLRDLVASENIAALVKAAQRGRLRVVRRGSRLLSTSAWIDEYRAGSRKKAGPPAARS